MSDAGTLPPGETGSNPPSRRRALLIKLFLIFAGYVIAVTAAVIVTVVLMLAPTALPDNGAQGSFFATVAELMPAMLIVGFFWTFICALPGFVLAIVIGERSRWSGLWTYAVAGFFNVIPSLAMFGGLAGSPFEIGGMTIAAFPGGLAGGAAYWKCAGRFVALRRKPA